MRLLDGDLVTPFLKMSSVPRGSCWWQAPSPCEGLLRAYGGCTNQAPGIQVCVRDKSLLCVFLRGISLPDSSINKKMYACPRSARSLERHKRLWDVFRALPQGPMWTLLLPGPPGTLCDHCSLLWANTWCDGHIISWKEGELKDWGLCPGVCRSPWSIWSCAVGGCFLAPTQGRFILVETKGFVISVT